MSLNSKYVRHWHPADPEILTNVSASRSHSVTQSLSQWEDGPAAPADGGSALHSIHYRADSMAAMGAIAPTAKKLWGRCPKSPHRNFVMSVF